MVDKASIIEITNAHVSFYKEIISESKIMGDIERANYGLSQASSILEIIKKAKTEFKNIELKNVHSKLINLISGVEYFEAPEADEKKHKLGEVLYAIVKSLEPEIKW